MWVEQYPWTLERMKYREASASLSDLLFFLLFSRSLRTFFHCFSVLFTLYSTTSLHRSTVSQWFFFSSSSASSFPLFFFSSPFFSFLLLRSSIYSAKFLHRIPMMKMKITFSINRQLFLHIGSNSIKQVFFFLINLFDVFFSHRITTHIFITDGSFNLSSSKYPFNK